MSLTLVTGATGFLGGHVCRLLREERIPVRVLARGVLPTAEFPECAVCRDLTDRPCVRAAMAGVHAVVHLAGRAHTGDDASPQALAEFRRVNVDGTRVLLEVAAAAGVRRVIFVSSVKAVGEASPPGGALTEESTPAPEGAYGTSKLEAEEVVRGVAARHGISAAILRLPLVYGPGVKANMLRLFEWVEKGVPLPIGAIRNRRSFVYVENVAAAIAHLLRLPDLGIETFFVSDGEPISTPELARRIARALDRRPRLLPVPAVLLRAAARLGDAARPWLRLPVDSELVRRLTDSLVIDDSRLRRTGFQVPVDFDEGLRRTADWLHATRIRGG